MKEIENCSHYIEGKLCLQNVCPFMRKNESPTFYGFEKNNKTVTKTFFWEVTI